MNQEIVNHVFMAKNNCFGCGQDNPMGLHLEVFYDEQSKDRLRGIFHPSSNHTGFPGITHGGIIYSALDCIAAWVPTALRKEAKAIWILRSAQMTYHKAAREGEPLHLVGSIQEENSLQAPMLIKAEAFNDKNELLAEGEFKVIPLSAEKFKKIAGIDAIPESAKKILE